MRDPAAAGDGALLFVGHRRGAVTAARRRGREVLLVASNVPEGPPPPHVVGVAPVARDASPEAVAAAAVRLAGDRPVAAVLALTEGAVRAAAAAREALGVPGLARVVADRCSDKVHMKARLGEAGLPCTDWMVVEATTTADEIVDRLGLPVVLKQRAASGSRGLRIAADAAALVASMQAGDVAERYVRGVEMSVESFVVDGRVAFLNPTEYLVTAHANILPVPLPAAERQAIERLNAAVIDALDIRAGITHLELFRTPAGPVASEIAARPPGGRIMSLLKRAWGFDAWDALLEIAVGGQPGFPARPREVAGVWLLHPGAGRVAAVAGLEAAAAVEHVHRVKVRVAPGDVIAPRVGTGQDVGLIEACGPSRDAVARALRAAHDALRIQLVEA